MYGGGYFRGTAALGGISLASVADFDGFVVKLTDAGSSGSFTWAQRAGGPVYDETSVLSASGSALYAAGSFSGTGAAFGATTLNSLGFTDLFVARLTDVGNGASTLWAQQAGGSGSDYARAITLTSTGTTYVGGTTVPPAIFGSQAANGRPIVKSGFSPRLPTPRV